MVKENQDCLIEIGTEELPPRALLGLSQAFATNFEEGLAKENLGFSSINSYATPRRLALLITELQASQADQLVERRGPALNAAFDEDGNPTKAAAGFARSCGVEVEELETLDTEKGSWLIFREQKKGLSVHELLPALVATVMSKLPIPKRMRWGSLRAEFARPVHWLCMVYGDQLIKARLFGLETAQQTYGHRFHHPNALFLAHAQSYAPLLESEGHVLPNFELRKQAVCAQVEEAAALVKGNAVIDDDLLNEVTSMVEWPVAVLGSFDRKFLELPEEALISVMKGHQRYFHLRDFNNQLMPHFITISNIESRDPEVVRRGNERVILPRFADAAFFWNQDRKHRLFDRIEALNNVIFEKQLGSLYEKVVRVSALAVHIATLLQSDLIWAERAGWLCKCDLMTDMVGEFPELQGIMGRYYAIHDGEPADVAKALEEQYLPRSAGDQLPTTVTGQVLAIGDKLDTLVGIFLIDQLPTGDKDPYALRRAALGVLRIMIEQKLDLDLVALIKMSIQGYDKQKKVKVKKDSVDAIYDFMMERLRAYYHSAEIGADVFDAVLSMRPPCPYDFDARIRAVEHFRHLPEAESLAVANKRIRNILRKTREKIPEKVDRKLLTEKSEQVLAESVTKLSTIVKPMLETSDYQQVLTCLAGLKEPVDSYFDKVMVMAEDKAIRSNRLAQLSEMQKLFTHVADLSCLHGAST